MFWAIHLTLASSLSCQQGECFLLQTVEVVGRPATRMFLPQLSSQHAACVHAFAADGRWTTVHAVGSVSQRGDVTSTSQRRRWWPSRSHSDTQGDHGIAATGRAAAHCRECVETGDVENNMFSWLCRFWTPCHSSMTRSLVRQTFAYLFNGSYSWVNFWHLQQHISLVTMWLWPFVVTMWPWHLIFWLPMALNSL